ncbi:MAG: hypothetical protein HC888_07825 [Candidatus Competibacteraceae bacterium]|nr:hypothetical protein [Candidatus Competibacteraceae bacterium]
MARDRIDRTGQVTGQTGLSIGRDREFQLRFGHERLLDRTMVARTAGQRKRSSHARSKKNELMRQAPRRVTWIGNPWDDGTTR